MNNTSKIPTIEVNGQQVPNFVASNDVQMAIVPLDTLQKLAAMLPSASLDRIKQDMVERISYASTVADYVEEIDNELNFHRTLNLITAYTANEASVTLVDATEILH